MREAQDLRDFGGRVQVKPVRFGLIGCGRVAWHHVQMLPKKDMGAVVEGDTWPDTKVE